MLLCCEAPCGLHHILRRYILLLSAKNDRVPTTQKSCVIYEFSCHFQARYIGHTTQRLADRIKQHVPTSIRTKNTTTREQPHRMCKNSISKMKSDSAIGQHLITNPECTKIYSEENVLDHRASKIVLSFKAWLPFDRHNRCSRQDHRNFVFTIVTILMTQDFHKIVAIM